MTDGVMTICQLPDHVDVPPDGDGVAEQGADATQKRKAVRALLREARKMLDGDT
jgi:hypothetical protein